MIDIAAIKERRASCYKRTFADGSTVTSGGPWLKDIDDLLDALERRNRMIGIVAKRGHYHLNRAIAGDKRIAELEATP